MAIASCVAVLTGCGFGATAGDTTRNAASQPQGPVVTSSLADNSTVEAGTKWKITAVPGWTIEVSGVDGGAPTTAGAIGATEWNSRPLPPGQRLTAAVVATSSEGGVREEQFSVTTKGSKALYSVDFSGSSSTKYGVGQMPTIEFSIPVSQKARKDVVAHLVTQVSPKNVPVKFRWVDSQTVAYRPEKFWPGKSKITVTADLSTVPVTYDGELRWGKTQTFKWLTGDSVVVNIRSADHRGDVRINGKKVRSFGVSTGKPGYTTRSGIKTITDKSVVTRMTNIGVTDDEVYDLDVPYSMRMTDTGEYLHGAPWNGNIGYANTSHGCTNLYTSDAAWIFSRAAWGTPVVTTGTGRDMETWNGPGGMWNIPWKKWQN